MTTPLTGQQLAATQARCGAASDVEWSAFRGGGYPFLIMQGTPAADAEGDDRWDGIGLIAANLALKPAEDMAFIIAAHRDMPALLADNARLRAELERARADVRRLAHAAENGKHSLAAFVSDSSDPGSAALGALYLLRGALAGQPDTEPAYLEVTPEALRAAHFREAARLLEDGGLDDDAVNLLDNVARGIAAPTPACSCRAEAVHQAGCDTDQGN